MRVAVIGLGVLGASVARSLAAAGARVTAYERDSPLAGTSGTSFAWTNSHNKNPRSYHELNVAGMAEHAALAANPGGCRAWHWHTGNLEWATDDDHAARLNNTVDALAQRDYPVERITPSRARELVPDLRLSDHVRDIACYPTEGHVIPPLLVARLWGEARDHGAELRCPVEVLDVTETSTGVRVDTSDTAPPGDAGRSGETETSGGTEQFDAAVIATGRWTGTLTAAAGFRVPMVETTSAGSATVGLLGYTTPVPTRVNRVLTSPELNVRPAGGGRLVVQGLDLDADADPTNPPTASGEHADQLTSRLKHLLAGTGGVRLESLRVGQRAMPADGLTVAGFLNDTAKIYTLSTHSGITLGPLLGKLAAREVIHDDPADALAEFRPQRLRDAEPPKPTPARRPGQQ